MSTDTTTPAALNGHVPEDEHALAQRSSVLSTALEQHAIGLRALLESQHELVASFERCLHTAKEEQRRIQRSLAALEGESLTTPRATPKTPTSQPVVWQVSDRKIGQVLDALIEHTANGEAISGNRLAVLSRRLSAETVRRALVTLRERELVRVTGKSRGGGNLWLPMPDVDKRRAR